MRKFLFLLLCLLANDASAVYARGIRLYYNSTELTVIVVILSFIILVMTIFQLVGIRKKKRQAKELADKLAEVDPMWNHQRMVNRVEEVFFKTKNAWRNNDYRNALEFMSERIMKEHQNELSEMKESGYKNVLENMRIHELAILALYDYNDNSKDSFRVYLRGSMIDYQISIRTKDITSGSKTTAESFTQMWTFKREGKRWVVDEIDSKAGFDDIKKSNSKVE